MKNKKIILIFIVLICLIVLFLGFNILFKESLLKNRIKSILIINEYVEEESNIFTKNFSNITDDELFNNMDSLKTSFYDKFTFNLNTFKLTQNKVSIYDDIIVDLIIVYEYKTSNLVFTERINYNNGNAIIKGSNNGEFICKLEYQFGFNNLSEQEICENILSNINIFELERINLLKSPSLLKKLKTL